MRGRSEVVVIDSLTTSVGLAFLVETAARAAETTSRWRAWSGSCGGHVTRVYSVFYVETLDLPVSRPPDWGKAQAILVKSWGSSLPDHRGRRAADDGEVAHRLQAVDRLIEFVTEFSDIRELVIVQNTPISRADRLIQDRLALEFGGRDFPINDVWA
jgi:hypothetical protein